MAAKFWVGGTGNWDASTTTHWSTTSGGGGGAAVPSSSDDVTFDSNSGAAATVTITAAANANSITINKSDLTLTHSAGSTVVGLVTLTTGTLNTNGQTCSWGGLSSTNSNTRTLTLGASAITLTSTTVPWDTGTTTGMTFNANTSSITVGPTGVTGGIAIMNAGNLTYNSVTFAVAGITNQSSQLTGSSPTFANLTVTGNATTGAVFNLGTSITVTTTLTMTGNSAAINRLLIRSTTPGTARTITNNSSGTTTFTNLDLQDVTGAGSVSWNLSAISGNSGDCGGNSGITFTTARNLFWVGGTANWSGANKWSLTTGGTANQSNPLAQDNITFDGSSFSGAGQTVTLNMPRAGKNIDFTNATNSPTFATSLGAGFNGRIYGSLTLISAMSISGTGALAFEGRGSNTYTTAGFATTWSLTLIAPGGTLTLVGDFSTSASTANVSVNAGTLTTTSSNVTAPAFQLAANSSPVVAKTLTMGSGTWTATGTGFVWNTTTSSSLTINSQTSTVVVNDASATSKTFSGNSFTYNNITFSGDNITVSGNNTFNNLNINNAGLANGLKMGANSAQTVTGNITTNGSAGNLAILTTVSSTSTLTKTSGTVSVDYMNIANSHAGGGATYYAGAHSTDSGGNTGWIFTAPPSGNEFLVFM